MPDATYVGAGMPCGNCGNPLTAGQPHKCGRTPDFDRRLDESWEPSPAASPDERLREAGEQLANLVTLLAGSDGPGYFAAPNQGERPDYYATAKLFDRIMRDEKTGAAIVLAEWRAALAAADREAPDEEGRICCRGMGADGGCNICAAEATR